MTDEQREPPHRDDYIRIRLDPELKAKAMKAARPYGGLSSVIRAFLRLFISNEKMFSIEDLSEENTQAPKRPRKKKDDGD
jgi:antitoxin component of RelBE/YafQ-DinJ toxin-antitoxin module